MNSGEYLDRILEEFSRIATIPRPSHHEKQMERIFAIGRSAIICRIS